MANFLAFVTGHSELKMLQDITVISFWKSLPGWFFFQRNGNKWLPSRIDDKMFKLRIDPTWWYLVLAVPPAAHLFRGYLWPCLGSVPVPHTTQSSFILPRQRHFDFSVVDIVITIGHRTQLMTMSLLLSLPQVSM